MIFASGFLARQTSSRLNCAAASPKPQNPYISDLVVIN
jgi:hypothetical protein